MKWQRSLRVLWLTLLLIAGVSCSTSDGSLTGIPDSEPVEQPSPLLGDILDDFGVSDLLDGSGGGDPVSGTSGLGESVLGDVGSILGGAVGSVLEITDLLTCSQQEYVAVTQTIGPSGGTIKVGEHILVIPDGALSGKVRIKAEQMRGSTNSVRFSPEGLRFERPAVLTMSYKNCVLVLLPKTIVYTTERFKILEVLRSLDLFRRRTVSAPIDHFSRYAVAY